MATITAGLLCDFAQVREGLLFIVSGGVTRLTRPRVPAPMGVMLALMIEIPPHEQGQAHELTVAIKRPDTAHELGRVTSGVQVQSPDMFPGETMQVPATVDLRGLMLPDYGSYDVVTTIDDTPGPLLTVYAVKPPASSAAQP